MRIFILAALFAISYAKLVIITLDVLGARQLIEILRSKIFLEHSTQRSGVTLRCKAFSVWEINHPQDASTVTLRLTLFRSGERAVEI
eukprot:UN11124